MTSNAPFGKSILNRYRKWLFGLLALILLVVVFYAVENWRGRRAWEALRQKLVAQGEVLDWEAFIPPPIPDDQNFFKAPKMDTWFNRETPDKAEANRFCARFNPQQPSNAVPILEVQLWRPEETNGAPAWCDADHFATDDAFTFCQNISRLADQPILRDPRAGTVFIVRSRTKPPLPRVHVQLSSQITPQWLDEKISRFGFKLELAPQTNVMRLLLSQAWTAQEILSQMADAQAELDILDAACQRPHARLEGNYHDLVMVPIPNFVSMRKVTQALAVQAKAHCLLGNGEAALRDLATMRQLMGYLQECSITLVAAMVNVAIGGLYAGVIEDGLSVGVWEDAQLAALEKQIRTLNLPDGVAAAIRSGERAGMIHLFEVLGASGSKQALGDSQQLWDIVGLYITLAPRGWIYQNQVCLASIHQVVLEIFDSNRRTINPQKAKAAEMTVERALSQWGPYRMLARISIPNMSRAWQRTAMNQNLLDQIRIVSALVRYRRESGVYPESLSDLAPRFLDPMPQDIVTGESMSYRRLSSSQFLLYSVGWNAQDDGGKLLDDPGAMKQSGDWVWTAGVK